MAYFRLSICRVGQKTIRTYILLLVESTAAALIFRFVRYKGQSHQPIGAMCKRAGALSLALSISPTKIRTILPGVNVTNVLHIAFTLVDPESVELYSYIISIFL
jgi:hypothetical protein